MCLSLRKIASRGLSAVPVTFLRIRYRMRRRMASLSICFFMASSCLLRAGLAGLLANLLADVTHALPLVNVRGTELAHLGGDLSDLLAVDPGHRELGLLFD